MTAYANIVTAKTATLAAATVDTVTFTKDLPSVEIVNHGTVRISYTTDGSTPTVDGDNCLSLMAGGAALTAPQGSGVTVVSLISSGTPTYTVQVGY